MSHFDIATVVSGLVDCTLPRTVVAQRPLDCELFAIFIDDDQKKKARPLSFGSASPILGLTLHGRRRRVLEFKPIRRPAGTVARAQPLRHDAFGSQLHA
jgi:hypothetical protein